MSDTSVPALPVAPLVEAWIEIAWTARHSLRLIVAPLVEAWIEIFNSMEETAADRSLLSWKRGLK